MKRYIKEELEGLEASSLKRTLWEVEGPTGATIEVGGRELLNLSSNDYLGLANSKVVAEAAISSIGEYGLGSGASRLVTGTLTPHRRLEERVAAFKGTEAALLFNSGYNANVGTIPVLAGRSSEIFSDKLNHASIIDGCILSRAKLTRYNSRDMDSLKASLKRSSAKRRLIVTDGVFSMDGTVAPLKEIGELANRYGAMVYIDDAHGTGVLGRCGRGTLSEITDGRGIEVEEGLVQMGTFSKGLGTFGAFVAGSRELVELLINRSRAFIYTTALPPAICSATIKAIDICEEGSDLRERVKANAELLRRTLKERGMDTMESRTQIIPILVEDPEAAVIIRDRLIEEGIFLQGIRPPTVPVGTSRLRATVMATHTEGQIKSGADVISRIINEVRGGAACG